MIVALFSAFILFLDQEIVKNGREASTPRQQTRDVTRPVFDFYTVLPEREVDIPVEESGEAVPNPSSDRQLSSDARFILQAGSFARAEDADRRKAELAFLGLEPTVARVMVNGAARHRVELGPYVDDGRFSDVKNRLIKHDIQFLVRSAK